MPTAGLDATAIKKELGAIKVWFMETIIREYNTHVPAFV